MNQKVPEQEEVIVDFRNRSEHVHLKSRKQIFIDNFFGGMAWGLGSVVGATLIVGILGIAIVKSKTIPLVGDVVKVVVTEIQTGIKAFSSQK